MCVFLQVQNDLTKDGGYLYFVKHLESDDADIVPESRAQAAFVLAAICRNNKKGNSYVPRQGFCKHVLRRSLQLQQLLQAHNAWGLMVASS